METVKQIEDVKQKGFATFAKALYQLESAKKDGKNPHFRSDYSTLKACNEVIKPVIKDTGIVVNHASVNIDGDYVVKTAVTYLGQEISSSFYPYNSNERDHAKGSSITYGKRYNLCMLFNLDSEDDDGNAGSGLDATPADVRTSRKKNPITPGQLKFVQGLINRLNLKVETAISEWTFDQASAFITKYKDVK